ncbi:YrbL family protein [Arcobacter sp. LA11]|uniref:YrbL family protein n=1 Tax=Arcobacter sp. LA11 TaxID=1898176 RepID=UPI000934E490|nr:YrbL family protein [Arcobacter sp. LA11]
MSELINLDENMFLGKGRERAGYIHPIDNSKVIKIVHAKNENLRQNELEYSYMQYLEKNNIPFTHITKCYGKTITNLGEGYVFDIVRDFNGKVSKSFKKMVLKGKLSKKKEKKLIKELKDYIFENNILFVDIALSNILCQRIKKKKYKLILTDGIGGKRPGLKSKLYQYSKLFTRYKVVKQWDKFIDKYNREVRKGISKKTRDIN